MTDYKSYQQVISLSIRPTAPSKVKKTKVPKSQPKIRTKTGCLTCRKRKKKCDEHIVDGKCQGCTRNFLDCSWPVLQQLKERDQAIPVIGISGRKSSICSESSEVSNLSLVSNNSTTMSLSPRDSYPSPKSPSLDDMPIKLPPLRFLTKDKTSEPKEALPKQQINFVITSLDDNKLCSIRD